MEPRTGPVLDVDEWLQGIGLARYAGLFRDNDIDGEILRRLSGDDLKDLGVSLGHRKKLLEAIEALGAAAEPAMPPPTAAARREAERRQLTVMFVDLVGSTALSARLDPEAMSDILRGYQNTVAGEVSRFEGSVAKLMGDGVLAYFGWPRAHEDDAERSVRAGLAIVTSVARLAGGGEVLACRIGIATGLVVVGELVGEGSAREEAVVGDAPNLAARLQALAEPGQIVVAEATQRLLGDLFALRALGPQRLKGSPGSRWRSRCWGSGPWRAGSPRAATVRSSRCLAATRSWRCCSSAGGWRERVRASWSCSPARPGSASRGSPVR
jgi:class 3 adenylate cyclase